MKTKDFTFELPPKLIAQYPLSNRSDSRLLTYRRANDTYTHHQFKDISALLEPGDLLVFNDSKVIPARLYGYKPTGGKVEFLLERIISPQKFLSHIKASKALKPGDCITLDQTWSITVEKRVNDLFLCSANGEIEELLASLGHIPLPPYIERYDEILDKDRYQTIYARHKGSVAAPTAGLHFDEEVFAALKKRGVRVGYMTLHVGAGTFRPVRADNIEAHKMHEESFHITPELCELVLQTKAANKRVIAVGTTALRGLESAGSLGKIEAFKGETDIFIYPGFSFKICDGLVTNFHLPESTLLMLVAALIGYEQMRALYHLAVVNQYRFFSYGDACLLL